MANFRTHGIQNTTIYPNSPDNYVISFGDIDLANKKGSKSRIPCLFIPPSKADSYLKADLQS